MAAGEWAGSCHSLPRSRPRHSLAFKPIPAVPGEAVPKEDRPSEDCPNHGFPELTSAGGDWAPILCFTASKYMAIFEACSE